MGGCHDTIRSRTRREHSQTPLRFPRVSRFASVRLRQGPGITPAFPYCVARVWQPVPVMTFRRVRCWRKKSLQRALKTWRKPGMSDGEDTLTSGTVQTTFNVIVAMVGLVRRYRRPLARRRIAQAIRRLSHPPLRRRICGHSLYNVTVNHGSWLEIEMAVIAGAYVVQLPNPAASIGKSRFGTCYRAGVVVAVHRPSNTRRSRIFIEKKWISFDTSSAAGALLWFRLVSASKPLLFRSRTMEGNRRRRYTQHKNMQRASDLAVTRSWGGRWQIAGY